MNKHKFRTKSQFHDLKGLRLIRLLFIWPLLALAHVALVQAAELDSAKFDHIKTGFNLTGAHVQARCESCHIQGLFKGTPRDCATCHMAGNRTGATAKPGRHVPTTAPCDSCHRTTGWVPASYSHAGVAPGSCMTCHNGSMSTGKPSGHTLTTESCDKCHRTTAWFPAGYNHLGIAPGTCKTCHGVTATGMPSGHTVTSDSCDKCHRTTAWLPAYFDHTGVVPGTCATCHNGTTAKGVGGSATSSHPKVSGHVPTTLWPSCDICHKSTTSFLNAKVHGSGASVSGNCNICHSQHNNSTSCDKCHTSTSNWSSGV
jgi:hypothetical protein